MNGLVCEARLDYHSAAAAYRLARCAVSSVEDKVPNSVITDISINLARAHCKVNIFNIVFSAIQMHNLNFNAGSSGA